MLPFKGYNSDTWDVFMVNILYKLHSHGSISAVLSHAAAAKTMIATVKIRFDFMSNLVSFRDNNKMFHAFI